MDHTGKTFVDRWQKLIFRTRNSRHRKDNFEAGKGIKMNNQ